MHFLIYFLPHVKAPPPPPKISPPPQKKKAFEMYGFIFGVLRYLPLKQMLRPKKGSSK